MCGLIQESEMLDCWKIIVGRLIAVGTTLLSSYDGAAFD
jgi:hypothetical protein